VSDIEEAWSMGQFGIGQAVRRTEDLRFVTGAGRYTDDINLPGQTHAYVLRSPHAHARLGRVATEAARAVPGVLAVLTAADLAADGVKPIPCVAPITSRDGTPPKTHYWTVLAAGTVRHVGDPVALIVAETPAAARDAADLIEVDYEPLASVTGTAAALEPGRPQIWDDAPDNICFDWELGDAKGVADGFAKARHVVELDLVNNRIVVASMEGRAAIGQFDAAEDRCTLHTSSQGSHNIRGLLTKSVFEIPEEKLRVVTPDVGGGFGMKLFTYPEYALVLWAAKRVGRPVKWTAERGEAFLSDTHGRDHVSRATLALDDYGTFLALRVSTIANLGAYLSNYGIFVPTLAGSRMLAGLYRTPAIHVEVKGVCRSTPIAAPGARKRPI